MGRPRSPTRKIEVAVDQRQNNDYVKAMDLLGGSGGVVNSLDFCPASLKSLGCFYFRCVLSSQWKAVTVNF